MARKAVIRHRDLIIAASLGALLIAGAVLLYVMAIAPATSMEKLQAQKVAEATQELDRSSREARQVEALVKSNENLRTRLAVFDGRIPARNQVVGLFAEVLRFADQNDLRILHTRPLPSTPVGQGLYQYPYEVELHGRYHHVARFINAVESHDNFMRVKRAELTGTSDQDGEIVRVKLLLHLYGGDDNWAGPARRDRADTERRPSKAPTPAGGASRKASPAPSPGAASASSTGSKPSPAAGT